MYSWGRMTLYPPNKHSFFRSCCKKHWYFQAIFTLPINNVTLAVLGLCILYLSEEYFFQINVLSYVLKIVLIRYKLTLGVLLRESFFNYFNSRVWFHISDTFILKHKYVNVHYFLASTNRRHLLMFKYNPYGCITALKCRTPLESLAYSKLNNYQ